MTRQEFHNLISFCILMQANGGIRYQDPSYVLEKYEARHPSLLDGFNKVIFNEYCNRWKVDEKEF